MKRMNFTILGAAAFLVSGSLAFANVSLKNGNFFTGNLDMIYHGGFEPKIETMYNSKSSFNGMFGFGWGSEYEVYLVPSIDGSVTVHENGGGSTNRFVPANVGAAQVEQWNKNAINEIAAARAKLGAGFGSASESDYKKHLTNDSRFRIDEWERVFRAGLVQARPVHEGTVFKSNKFSFQTLTKTKDGYVRRFDSGRVEFYRNDGRLAEVMDHNRNFVKLLYNKNGQVATLADNLNRKMNFYYYPSGKVRLITGENKKSCEYQYDGFALTYRKNSKGEVYRYKYSTNGRYNLVEVIFPDKSVIRIDYNDVSKGETVSRIRDRDNSVSEYSYNNDGPEGFYRGTQVSTKNTEGKEISKAHYEYWDKLKSDGDRYTYKMATDIDGEKTETVFNECCGLALQITRNGEKTSFEYDSKGHVTRKTTPYEVTELAYDPQASKVSKVVRYPKNEKDPKKVEWVEYKYDAKGNLQNGRNSKGQSVTIFYGMSGQIRAMVDQDKHQLNFVYNEANRPVEIGDPKLGKLKMRYTNAGDLAGVETVGNRAIAGQITSVFQNLMELIRPAGVSITP